MSANTSIPTGNSFPITSLLGILFLLLPLAGHGETSNYVLSRMDVVTIQVYGESDLSKVQRIDGTGQIRMGLIGTVEVAGLSLREAEKRLESAYVEGRYLRAPQVSMSVEEYAPQYVSILGEVSNPGRIQLEGESVGIRLVDAISAVGGFTGIAKGDAVRITRVNPDGSEKVVTVDAAAVINGRQTDIPDAFLTLKPGDVVNVPERLF